MFSALSCVLGITPHPVHIIPCSCSLRILKKIAYLLYYHGRSVKDAILEATKTCHHRTSAHAVMEYHRTIKATGQEPGKDRINQYRPSLACFNHRHQWHGADQLEKKKRVSSKQPNDSSNIPHNYSERSYYSTSDSDINSYMTV